MKDKLSAFWNGFKKQMELAREKSADIHNNGSIGSRSCRDRTCDST